MRRGLLLSVAFHGAVGVLLIVGLARFGRELPAEQLVTVEIVSAETLQAAEAQAATAPKPEQVAASPAPAPEPEQAEPEPPKPEPPKPEPAPEPAPPKPEPPKPEPPKPPPPEPEPPKPEPPKPVVKAEPPPRPDPKPAPPKPPEPKKPEPAKKAEKKPEPDKKPPPKKPEPKKAEPKPEAEKQDFAALLRSVEKLDKRTTAEETREGKGAGGKPGKSGTGQGPAVAQMSPSQLAGMISRQVTPCWRIPIGSQGGERMRTELNIVVGADGNVVSVEPLDAGRMASDPVYRAFAESAVRAVRACSPLKLPPESYHQWRNVIFNFDPAMMAG